MARHEVIQAGAPAPLGLDDLLDLLSADPAISEKGRHEAIACYLSGGEGWNEAVKRLGGAFADETKVKGA